MLDATQIAAEELERALQPLVHNKKARILCKTPASKHVAPTDRLTINEAFTSSTVRIKVPQLLQAEAPRLEQVGCCVL